MRRERKCKVCRNHLMAPEWELDYGIEKAEEYQARADRSQQHRDWATIDFLEIAAHGARRVLAGVCGRQCADLVTGAIASLKLRGVEVRP